MLKLKSSKCLVYVTICLLFDCLLAKTVKKDVGFLETHVEMLYESDVNKTDSLNDLHKEPKLKWLETKNLVELTTYLMHQEKTNTSNLILIDTRDSNEYNGWKSIQNNQTDLLSFYDMKNGHISFAHNFCSDWIDTVDPESLHEFLMQRFNLNPKNSADLKLNMPRDRLILYDTNILRLEKVKNFLLERFSIHTVYLCRIDEDEIGGLFEKTNETTNLFFQEPFYDMLISPEILNAIIRPFSNESELLNVNPIVEYKLFDVSSDNDHYKYNHIPTAVQLDTKELEDPSFGVRKNTSEAAKVLLDLGIMPNNSEMIILYGNPDPMAAFRAALIMKWMGVKDIRVLNGGYGAWILKNLSRETISNKRTSILNDQEDLIKLFDEQSINTQSSINYIVDQDYVLDLVKNQELFADQYELVDVRSYDEYVGEESGYDDLKVKGRIPNSIWGGSGNSSNHLQDYRNPDLTMRSGYEILKMWDELGIDYKNKHLIFYCGNGWRSSEVIFYAELMGLYRISFYDGGWYDWTRNKNNAIQIGNKYNSTIVFENATLINETSLVAEFTNTTENTTQFYNSTESFNTTILTTSSSSTLFIVKLNQTNSTLSSPTTLPNTTLSSHISSSAHSIYSWQNFSFIYFLSIINYFIYVIYK